MNMHTAFNAVWSKFVPAKPIIKKVWSGPLAGSQLYANYANRPHFLLGTYERRLVEAINANLSPGQIAYDIGANIGYVSLVMARMTSPGGKVYAFEPAPNAYAMLETNSRLNKDLPFETFHMAIADEIGQETFSFFDFDVVSRLGNHSSEYKDAHLTEVKVETLDNLVANAGLPPPDFAKIDVEGAEMRVLLGMEMILKSKKPRLLIEIHSEELDAEIRPYLAKWGYNAEIISANIPKHILFK